MTHRLPENDDDIEEDFVDTEGDVYELDEEDDGEALASAGRGTDEDYRPEYFDDEPF